MMNKLCRTCLLICMVLSGQAFADCLDFASVRGYLPQDASGLQGELVLLDAPSKEEVALYVKKDARWCFLSLRVARNLCEEMARFPEPKTRLQAAYRTLVALDRIGYTCEPVEGTADH